MSLEFELYCNKCGTSLDAEMKPDNGGDMCIWVDLCTECTTEKMYYCDKCNADLEVDESENGGIAIKPCHACLEEANNAGKEGKDIDADGETVETEEEEEEIPETQEGADNNWMTPAEGDSPDNPSEEKEEDDKKKKEEETDPLSPRYVVEDDLIIK
jgi:hypothetical protein